VYKKANKVLPDDPWEQLRMGIDAVFRSWNIPRAVKYREINKITGLRGTAVNVQTMVYGNINDNSGTGGCFAGAAVDVGAAVDAKRTGVLPVGYCHCVSCIYDCAVGKG
jgi:phosphoenolpyruvate synthase/pyruvate phosphate dikinase